MGAPVIIFLAIIAFIAIMVISMYNGLIRRRNELDNAFGGMDAQLKMRYDLIPNLVSVVKKYAEHERELLSKITELRSKVMGGNLSTDEKVAVDNKISEGLKSIMVAVENYPDLKASENFLQLQRSLNEVESQISAARRTYNAVITNYNNGIQVFPQNILANMLNMTHKPVFEIPQAERENVDVSKLF